MHGLQDIGLLYYKFCHVNYADKVTSIFHFTKLQNPVNYVAVEKGFYAPFLGKLYFLQYTAIVFIL